MRFASTIFALATAALVAAQPATRNRPNMFNPPREQIRPEFAEEIGAPNPEPQSNAKRFAAGLPPLAPKAMLRHRQRQRGAPNGGGSGVDSADRAKPSHSPAVDVKCNIRVKTIDGSDLGFIAPTWNDYGEYGLFQKSQDGALEVSFSRIPDDPSSSSDLTLTATNSPSGNYPFFGLSSGWDYDGSDIGTGTSGYGYVVGTKGPSTNENSFNSAVGSEESAQTPVWKYNAGTQEISAQWINENGSRPPTHLFYANDFNQALGFTADVKEMNEYFASPENPHYPEVTFTCVPPGPVVNPPA